MGSHWESNPMPLTSAVSTLATTIYPATTQHSLSEIEVERGVGPNWVLASEKLPQITALPFGRS